MLFVSLVQPGFGGLAKSRCLVALRLDSLERGRIDELFHRQRCFNTAQIADNDAAKTVQESGKCQSHQPQCTLQPFFSEA